MKTIMLSMILVKVCVGSDWYVCYYVSPVCSLSLSLSPVLGAIVSEDSVRVCPSMKSRRGWVWSKNSLSASHWFVDVTLKVTGRVKSGADGMVRLWYYKRCI